MTSSYNGWTNRETWLVNVWFEPQNVTDVDLVRKQLEELVEALDHGCLRDLVGLGYVNWDEIKEGLQW